MRGGPSNGLEDCSSEFRHRRGRPERPEELAYHRTILFSGLSTTTDWRFEEDGRELRVRIGPSLATNSGEVAIEHARAGGGLPCALGYQVRDLVRSGAARDRIEPVRAARFSDPGSLSVGAFSRGPCTRPDRHRSPSRSPRPLDPASASLSFRRQSCLLREFGGRADVRVRIRVQSGEAPVFRLSRILVRNAPAILHVATLAASPPERYVVQEGNEKWLRLPDQSRECERLRNREMQRLRRREQVPRRSPERKSEHRLQRVKAR